MAINSRALVPHLNPWQFSCWGGLQRYCRFSAGRSMGARQIQTGSLAFHINIGPVSNIRLLNRLSGIYSLYGAAVSAVVERRLLNNLLEC